MVSPIVGVHGELLWVDRDRRLHRDDNQPALIYENGRKLWFVDGKLIMGNRANLPALFFHSLNYYVSAYGHILTVEPHAWINLS